MPLSIGRGPRLEFVVRELKGNRTRVTRKMTGTVKKLANGGEKTNYKMEEVPKKEPAGYMVYFPSGNSTRLTRKELLQRGYDRQPAIINFEQVNDTKSPAGRFKYAIDEKTKALAYKQLEEQVIKACKRRGGHSESGEDNDASAT